MFGWLTAVREIHEASDEGEATNGTLPANIGVSASFRCRVFLANMHQTDGMTL